jgi:hypothetical protein
MGRSALLASHCLANCCDRINPYWKLALVFKCLTDNILLDDFKSVLQRLGNPKEDGTTAMLPDSMNVNSTQKTGTADHHEEAFGQLSSRAGRDQPRDYSTAMPDYNQLPEESGNEYKTQGTAANAIGKLGIKIHKLPKLPS